MTNLRRAIAAWLRRLATWVDVAQPAVVTHDAALSVLAWTLVREQETRWPDRSGEAKRHQVFAQLIDAFPATSKRVLSRAIEDALL